MEDETRGKAWPLADAVLTDQVNTLLAILGGSYRSSSDLGSRAASLELQAAQEGC